MKIVLAGPTQTSSLTDIMPVSLDGAPFGTAVSPLAPLARTLRANGHAVHIVTLDASIDETLTVSDSGLSVTYCPFRGPPRFRARHRSLDLFEKEIKHLRAAIIEAEPDIIHAHWTYEYAEAAIRSRLPHLVTMHDLGWDYLWHLRDGYRLMRLMMKYRTMPRTRHLSVVAPFMAPKTKVYGYFGEALVIPNGVDIPPFDAGLAVEKIGNAPQLVTIGNRGRIKNVGASIRAFSHIANLFPQAKLHLFGPGLDADFAAALGDNIIGHGDCAHGTLMDFLHRTATLLIHPSLIEACPVIILEAKARGVPVIGGVRSGGVAYVCGHERGGLLVDVVSPQSLARAAITIIGDHALYARMARNAHHDVSERFDAKRTSLEYLDAYEAIVSGEKVG